MTVVHVVEGRVVLPDATVVDADLELTDGTITAIAPTGSLSSVCHERIAVDGHLVTPGFVDIQINGGWGHDFTADPTSIAAVAAELPVTGVTSFVPTVVTSPASRRVAAFDAVAALVSAPGSARPLGLHFEGPAISPARKGAHDERFIGMPDPDELDRWTPDHGLTMVTIAPELDGATDLIRLLVERGVVVAIGHTACTAAEFVGARAAGATVVTHLFNAMAPFGHRSPGPIGATLADPDVRAGLICDGIHADPVAIRMAWRSLGAARFVLVTDAMAALGVPDGETQLASLAVTVGPDGVRLADGTLAGSNLRLDQAVRNLVAMTDCAVPEAVRAATTTPADVIGRSDLGRIAEGATADLVVLDPDLHVVHTIIGGVTAWKS